MAYYPWIFLGIPSPTLLFTKWQKKVTCVVLWDLEPGCSIPIPTDWHALLCVSRLRGPRRQQRGMGLPWVAPQLRPQAPSQGKGGAPLPRRMGWRRGLPVIMRVSGSPRFWTRASQRQVSMCVCQWRIWLRWRKLLKRKMPTLPGNLHQYVWRYPVARKHRKHNCVINVLTVCES